MQSLRYGVLIGLVLALSGCRQASDHVPDDFVVVTLYLNLEKEVLQELATAQGGLKPLNQEGKGLTFESTEVELFGQCGSHKVSQLLHWGDNEIKWMVPPDQDLRLRLRSSGRYSVRVTYAPLKVSDRPIYLTLRK